MRATKLRTIENTLVVIPNAGFPTAGLVNVSECLTILYRQIVRVAPVVSEAKLRVLLEELSNILRLQPEIEPDTSRARLVELGQFSINLELFARVRTTDWVRYLEVAEQLNLSVIGALELVGVKLAEPRV